MTRLEELKEQEKAIRDEIWQITYGEARENLKRLVGTYIKQDLSYGKDGSRMAYSRVDGIEDPEIANWLRGCTVTIHRSGEDDSGALYEIESGVRANQDDAYEPSTREEFEAAIATVKGALGI